MIHHLMNRFAVFVLGLTSGEPDREGERPDRGDVPGWVLITLMTAGLVVALWALAGEAFTSMFQDAMNKVRGAG
ncbi:hypothetical protein [Brevibacterium marinum]|uniref:Uncharacterized protein n=1 Tax=Brevibacterium marinum TaxID=418643 RepID=A0A846S126_9MICO|nr:hypothetical protein [Brevibacterium marinum]NJC56673.1 hypothetical protein [Brevibacterium marinum]